MRRLTLNNRMGIGCVTFAAPKEPGMPIDDQSFTITDRKTTIVRELHWNEKFVLRNWCDAAIRERESNDTP